MPVGIRSDRAFQFTVRVGTASQAPELTSRERRHLLASSQAYLYLSDGTACLTGIEHISAEPGPATHALTVPAGPNAVTIHLIEWNAEAGAKDAHGKPTSGALPDFVVLISPGGAAGSPYRTRLETFDRA